MATIRRRLSNFIGLSEDSKADSEASNRAIRGHTDTRHSESDDSSESGWRTRVDSVFSSDSGYASTGATSASEHALPLKPASAGKLKKAASTTFQAISNSLRSKTQLFYASTGTDTMWPTSPQRSEPATPERLRDGATGTLWSSTRKRIGRSPRSLRSDTFDDPRTIVSETGTNLGSPGSRSVLWSSIRERANRSARADRENLLPVEDSPWSPVDDLAPSLDVDIPDGSFIMSQLIRSKSRARGSLNFATGRGSTDSGSVASADLKGAGFVEQRTTERATKGAATPPRVRFLELTPEPSPSSIPLPQTPNGKRWSAYAPNLAVNTANFREKRTIAIHDKTDQSAPSPGSSVSYINNLGTGLKDVSVSSTAEQDDDGMHAQAEESIKPNGSQAGTFGQNSLIDSPNPPSMGSPRVWKQARADRDSRYLALETDDDSESDSDLELVRYPADQVPGTGGSGTVEVEYFPSKAASAKKDSRHAVETIMKSWAKKLNIPTSIEPENRYGVPEFSGDLRYAVEAIERPSGKTYDSSNASSSANTPEKARLLSSEPNPVPYPCKLTHIVSPDCDSSIGFTGSSNNTGREKLFDQLLAEVETPVLGDYNPVANIRSPSSTSSVSTTGSCAVTTHDPLCYTLPPYPSMHMRSSPVGSTRADDRASDRSKAVEVVRTDWPDVTGKANLDPHASDLEESPWSHLLFDSGVNMKHTFKPMTPDRFQTSTIVADELKLTKELLTLDNPLTISYVDDEPKFTEAALSPDKFQASKHVASQRKFTEGCPSLDTAHKIEPAKVPPPEAPAPRTLVLPIRLKADHSPSIPVEERRNNQELPRTSNEGNLRETPSKVPEPQKLNEPSTSPRAKKNKKKSPKRKKSLKNLSPSKKARATSVLAETSGNSGKDYSYSEIVKGDRKVDTLKDVIGEVPGAGEVKADIEAEQSSPFKGTTYGVAEDTTLDESKANEPPSRSGSHKKGVQWAVHDEIIGHADPPSPVLKKKGSYTMISKSKAASVGDTKVRSSIEEEHSQDTDPPKSPASSSEPKPWTEEDKAAVARHLVRVVYDIEREAAKETEENHEEDELAFESAD